MAKYEYAGPGPVEDPDGGIVRPGDVRDEEPDWGPWRLLDEPEPEPEKPAPPPPAGPPAASPAPVATPAAPPAASGGK